MQAQIDEAIELLGNSIEGTVYPNDGTSHYKVNPHIFHQAFAKLKEEPEQGEFTKEMREKYKYAIKNKLTIHISAYVKALNVIDRLGDENKKLIEGQKVRKIAGS